MAYFRPENVTARRAAVSAVSAGVLHARFQEIADRGDLPTLEMPHTKNRLLPAWLTEKA